MEIKSNLDAMCCEFYVTLGGVGNLPKEYSRLGVLQARKLEVGYTLGQGVE